MIIMGGSFPNHTDNCDVPSIYGQHGLDLGKANSEGAKWAKFDPNVTMYNVPTEIAQSIGGGASGGATVLAPTGGWAHRDLQAEFERPYTPTTRTPTRHIPTPTAATSSAAAGAGGSNKKTIIAGAVGGVVGGLLLVVAVAVICLCVRRRRRANDNDRRPPSELPSQPISNMAGPPVSTQHDSYLSPSVTAYSHTPQGSPKPPSDPAWSQYGPATPEYPRSPGIPDKSGVVHAHHRSLSDQSYNHSLQSSPVGYHDQPSRSPVGLAQELPNVRSPPAQEMPNVRSPLSVGIQPKPQAANIMGVDPYYAQHPPRGAGT